ncbi:Epigen [Fukomys damarensis]|uniref:Epigen n=1 Tax=Fukomys damarensis TaxID=885580 RepID=A0A091DU32_FUKDA|nr:Epigen [Fukomys damarensis]
MALGVPVSAYLFFNANYVEGPIALRFSHPCLEDHSSYCINGMCAFHHELDQAICR